MDESLSKSLEYAERLSTFNNQIKLLKEQCLENNILYTQGHQFTVDLNLINYCLTLMNIKKTNEAIFLDDYKLPVKITDINSFYNNITDLYQRNLNQYFVEYNQLVKDKGEI
jgi:hypothetical protein|tara:strand:- start:22292 stop:22627 length:336 start_codon:yes stop_codon:yes gene_type:complete